MNSSTKKAAKPKMTVKNGKVYGDALSAEEKKKIVMQKKKDRKSKKVRKSAQLCHPNKNGHRKASKNGMNRILSFVFERRPHLFHGSLDNEPLPT